MLRFCPPRHAGLVLLAILTACGRLSDRGEPAAPRGPNFVVIFLDDVGYGDIQPFGGTVETPHLNRMAAEGMKLTSFYAAPLCSPSRAALLTGCYPKRVSLERGSWHGVLQPGDEKGLHPDEVTIAEVLKAQGYKTGVIGKWHLGDQPAFLPSKHGFDYWFGLPYSNDMIPENPRAAQRNFPPLALMRNDEVIETLTDQTTLTERYTEEAERFIEERRDEPFFLYVPHTMAHVPLYSAMRFKGRGKDILGDVLMELDWSVGRILDALRVNSLERRTLVVFTSDNGPARGSAGPLRGRKGSTFEGGMREPAVVWWPGTVPPRTASDEVVTTMDLLPTFAALAGASIPSDRILDGRDVSAILRGEPGARSPHQALYYYAGENLRAVRSGPWKLHASGELYNLDEDIGEQTDRAAERPEVAARLAAYLERAREDLGDGEERPGKNVRAAGFAAAPRFLIPRPGKEGAAAHEPVYRGPIEPDPNFERPPNW
jgi:arylsulfatase A-like enzyme